SHASTVPSRHAEPSAAVALELSSRRRGLIAMVEEPVDGRTRPGNVRPERTESPELAGEGRGGKVVRRKGGEVARPADARQRLRKPGATLRVVTLASPLVEGCVDRRRGALVGVPRKDEDDPVVLWQV